MDVIERPSTPTPMMDSHSVSQTTPSGSVTITLKSRRLPDSVIEFLENKNALLMKDQEILKQLELLFQKEDEESIKQSGNKFIWGKVIDRYIKKEKIIFY